MAATISPIGKYETIGTLGRGAHSTIFHVRREADGKPYALKAVPIDTPEDLKFLEQAQHEFRIAQMFDHSYLIKIFALETERDWFMRTRKVYLLIEYVNGKTLDSVKSIPLPQLVSIGVRVAAGLAYMHSKGVCHADIKPNNILWSPAGAVKIIDFGLSWLENEDKNRVQGTPEYIAPETAAQGIISERTDIYNFGATLYRLITGRHTPKFATSPGTLPMDVTMWKQLLKPIRTLRPDVPQDLSDVIHRCLEYHTHNRPPRMNTVQAELVKIAEKMVNDSAENVIA